MEFSLILSITKNGVIGTVNGNSLHSQKDREHFKMVTTYSPCSKPNLLIVGKKTWNSLPESMKHDNHYVFIILTKKKCDTFQNIGTNILVMHNIEEVLKFCNERRLYNKHFVIGGAKIFKLFLESFENLHFLKNITEIFLTTFLIDLDIPNVIKYQLDLRKFQLVSQNRLIDVLTLEYYEDDKICVFKKIVEVEFSHYIIRHKPFEIQYLKLVEDIVTYGVRKEVRNGISYSITDRQLKIDLEDGFPILTVRRSFWRGILEELLWMISGSTDVSILQKKDIHIWDGNSSKDYLEKNGFQNLEEGDIGAGYGFQMRYFGAKYINCHTSYKGQGVDQLMECVESIKNNPNSRRIIISLWNPLDLKLTVLPACHLLYQFTVTNGKLSCHLYQRSWDIMLGWNTSTAALLTHIISHFCNLKPGTLTHTICDLHIYEDHIEMAKTILTRIPYNLPKLEIIGPKPQHIDQYFAEQFKLIDYKSHDAIKMKLII